jgi:hypothetical protein
MDNLDSFTTNLTANLETMASTTSRIPYYINAMLSETSMHVLATALALLLSPLFAFYIHHDYKAFLSLGPGGTPKTPLGYLKIKLLSIVCLRNPYQPLALPPHFRPQKGYFNADALPQRKGERPVVQGIAPQRQQTQKSNENVYGKLVACFHALAEDPRNRLMERTSCFEKNSSGLFTGMPITRTCGGEICHAHPSDGSMHLTMHPADAKMMLENGWGERHPLARGGWCRRFVPKEFTLVYAPRDEDELDTVMKIVAASIWWVSGIDVNGEEAGLRRKSADVEAVGKAMGGMDCWACKARACAGSQVEKMTGDA